MSLTKGLSILLVFSRNKLLVSLIFAPSAPERVKQVLSSGDRFLSGGELSVTSRDSVAGPGIYWWTSESG